MDVFGYGEASAKVSFSVRKSTCMPAGVFVARYARRQTGSWIVGSKDHRHANSREHDHLSVVPRPDASVHAHRCVPVLLGVPRLRRTAEARARRLLRVLFLRQRAVPAGAGFAKLLRLNSPRRIECAAPAVVARAHARSCGAGTAQNSTAPSR